MSVADPAALRYVLARDPASGLFFELAGACAAANDWAEAVRVLRAGLGFHPGHLEARLLLGEALIQLGDTAGARFELEEAAGMIEGLSGRLYPALAGLHEAAGETEPALDCLKLAAAHAPLSLEAEEQMNRLEARAREERAARAQEAALGLLREGQAEAAVEVLKEALAGAPDDSGLEARLREAEEAAAQGRQANQVIGVLQGWLHNIREETES